MGRVRRYHHGVLRFCRHGTFAGLAQAFKRRNPAIRAISLSQRRPRRAGRPVTSQAHRIQGGGYAIAQLPLLDGVTVDGFVTVSDEERSPPPIHLPAPKEFRGLFVRRQSGGGAETSQGPEQGGTIAIVICDSGLKYLSTDLWQHVVERQCDQTVVVVVAMGAGAGLLPPPLEAATAIPAMAPAPSAT
jgi:hypothetical protein